MKTIRYYLPEESDAPTPPEGFAIIEYRIIEVESVRTDRGKSYTYATLPLRSLEENFLFACVASDGNVDIYQGADISKGVYGGVWKYLDGDEVFDLDKYKEDVNEAYHQ